MTRRIIVVTGTPGTGKTTFARMLARHLNAEYLPVGKFITRHHLFRRYDEKRRTKVVDMTKTSRRMRRLIKLSDHTIVVETHHPEGIIANDLANVVFVLRCKPSILMRRLRRKKWSNEKIRENVMAEILDSCYIHARSYYVRRKLVQLDTSHSNVKRSVRLAEKVLSGGKKPISRVNWLRDLENDASLSRYIGC